MHRETRRQHCEEHQRSEKAARGRNRQGAKNLIQAKTKRRKPARARDHPRTFMRCQYAQTVCQVDRNLARLKLAQAESDMRDLPAIPFTIVAADQMLRDRCALQLTLPELVHCGQRCTHMTTLHSSTSTAGS